MVIGNLQLLFQDAFPRKEFSDPSKWRLVKVITYVSLRDVCDFHQGQHPGSAAPTTIDLSMDGVPESKQNAKTLEIVSVRFAGCRKCYPIRIGISARDAEKIECEVTFRNFFHHIVSFPSMKFVALRSYDILQLIHILHFCIRN